MLEITRPTAQLSLIITPPGDRARDQAPAPQMLQPTRQVHTYVHYGYLWWTTAVPTPKGPVLTWYMMGNGGNVVALVPDYDAVVVVQAANYNKKGSGDRSFGLIVRVVQTLKR